MKRLLSVVMMLMLLAALSIPAAARGRRALPVRHAHASSRARTVAEQPRNNRSFIQKHRDKLTVAGGAVAGAVIGGLIGGKRGAGIGILAGGAGSALYTYKLRKKNHDY
jgi:hypothetical protein